MSDDTSEEDLSKPKSSSTLHRDVNLEIYLITNSGIGPAMYGEEAAHLA